MVAGVSSQSDNAASVPISVFSVGAFRVIVSRLGLGMKSVWICCSGSNKSNSVFVAVYFVVALSGMGPVMDPSPRLPLS